MPSGVYERTECYKKVIGKIHKKLWENPEYRKKMSKVHTGKTGINASNWKGGKIIEFGYVYIYQPSHPFSINKGYVRRSRLVMEKHLGRYLKPEEKMHHINKIRDDDRLENLRLFANTSEHSKFHYPHGFNPKCKLNQTK